MTLSAHIISQKIEPLKSWHASLSSRLGLMLPHYHSRMIMVLVLISAVIAVSMSWYVRHWQYDVWSQNPEVFSLADGTPLYTTTDAPYFLGMAQDIKRDGVVYDFAYSRLSAPSERQDMDQPETASLRDAPLLSVLISAFAKDGSVKAILEAGNMLIPLTAGLTALMIIIGLGATRYWLEACLAAAGSTICSAYLTRSGAGRIDTDQLNLGFFYLILGVILFSSRAQKLSHALVLTAFAGFLTWLFDWWYARPIFAWMFLVGLVWLDFATHLNLKRTLLIAVLFFGLSGLWSAAGGISSNYTSDSVGFEGLIFPNTFSTITELNIVPLSEIFNRISGSLVVGLFSMLGLGVWALRHPATAIVFGPAAGFAILNFVFGNRTIFYSAPILWFGGAYLLLACTRYCAETQVVRRYIGAVRLPLSLTAMMAAGFILIWTVSPTSYVQSPTFPRTILEGFSVLKQKADTPKSVVATWWDYGYSSVLFNRQHVLHDGGRQTTPSTYFFARFLLSNSQDYTAEHLHRLADLGYSDYIAFLRGGDMQDPKVRDDREVYLVLTRQMAGWMGSISSLGNWNIETGKPFDIPGLRSGQPFIYDKLNCNPTDKQSVFSCDGRLFNLNTGQFGDGLVLDGMVMSQKGVQVGGQKYNRSNSPYVLQAETAPGMQRNMLMHKQLFGSVFHQLFYLGRFNPDLFSLVYDGYPDMRIYRVHSR